VDNLYTRGTRALPSSREGEFLFSSDASLMPIVAIMAVRFVSGNGHAQSAFTRGAPSLSDNFDTVPRRVCAVENFAFCGAKTYLEYREALIFVSDHVRWPAASVLPSQRRRSPISPRWSSLVDRLDTIDEAALPE
jgi:hypothetical protein